jgi:prevent-host-death family protein
MAIMDTVSVTELNQQTARVLERVKSGESVEITEHGRSVARLVPAAPTTGVPALDRLIAQGRAVPATAPGPIPPTPPREDQDGDVTLTRELERMRADERY